MATKPVILKNYVTLEPGVRKRLVITDPRVEEVTIPDPKTKRPKTIRRLVWTVLEEDGVAVTKYFTVVSEKLAQMLMALWERRATDRICVEITQFGVDLAKDYEVRPC
jgi:hypothetical protein